MSEKFKKIITLLMRQDVPFHIEKKPIAYCACGDGKNLGKSLMPLMMYTSTQNLKVSNITQKNYHMLFQP